MFDIKKKFLIYELISLALSVFITHKIINLPRYDFIDREMSVYIKSLCKEFDVDSDLVFGILMTENETFNINAINKNSNGTLDCGLFQLNDKYLWTTFKNDYWDKDVELNPFNWKHNSYIAIKHIRYLQKNLESRDKVIMAYNCGITAVFKNKVPIRTKSYLTKVNYNIDTLKNKKR